MISAATCVAKRIVLTLSIGVVISTSLTSMAANTSSQTQATSTKNADSNNNGDNQAKLNNYSMDKLTQPIYVPIELDDDVPTTQSHLVKFSSLSPSLLAFLSRATGMPDSQQFRIIDSAGRVMPTLLQQVQKSNEIRHNVAAVAVESDNPVAMEKLRQALRIQIEKSAQNTQLTNDQDQTLKIELNELPSNQALAQANRQISTWWLANPVAPNLKNDVTALAAPTTQLQFTFSQAQASRPVQLQLYGSDDLQSWQMINQSVVNPFSQAKPTINASSTASILSDAKAQHTLTLNTDDVQYRYWQLVASQPLILEQVIAKQTVIKPSYFLTRSSFTQDSTDKTQWQLKLPTPMWVSGMDFVIPDNQLWQVSITKNSTNNNLMDGIVRDKSTANATTSQTILAKAQLDTAHKTLTWSPTVAQNLTLNGQMTSDNLPVTLLTPVYELYFLAQGKGPYKLVLNDSNTLSKPAIQLSTQQISTLGNSSEGLMLTFIAMDNPNAAKDRYRQWLLWSVLALILAALSWLAYRLYQQTTTQSPAE